MSRAGRPRDTDRDIQNTSDLRFTSAGDGPRLAWLDAGPRLAPVVVLLHSLGTDHRMWDYQIQQWSGRQRILAPDARGHGQSEWADLRSVDDWVADIGRVLDAAQVDRASFVGLSMGGVQAIAFCGRRPDRVTRLVLSDTFAELSPDVSQARVADMSGRPVRLGMPAFADDYIESTFTLSPRPPRAEVVREAIAGMPVEAYSGSARICFSARLENVLGSIKVPTLVLWGTADGKTPRPLSERLVARISDARLHEVAGAGHLANLENPEQFTALAGDFLEQP
jgi:3-oxoadipate enol-lactonase